MNRIAILLAAVGLGSGCVVSTNTNTCSSGALQVDWNLISAAGNSVSCTSASLSQSVASMDVWVDGALEAGVVPCTAYGVVLGGLFTSGSHSVMVAGYDLANNIIVRDSFTIDVCGDTATTAVPGEGTLDILPTNCQVSGDALTFSIEDVTMATPYVIWRQVPPAALTFTCGGGITLPVPLGYFDLTGIEETSASGATVYKSLCSTVATDVLSWGTPTHYVTFNSTLACF
jgi:hypothetical protein